MAKKEKKSEPGIFDALDSFMAMPLFDIASDESKSDDSSSESDSDDSMSFDFLPDDDDSEVSNGRKHVRPFHDGTAKAAKKSKENVGKSDDNGGGNDGE